MRTRLGSMANLIKSLFIGSALAAVLHKIVKSSRK